MATIKRPTALHLLLLAGVSHADEASPFMLEYWRHHNTSLTRWVDSVPRVDGTGDIDWVTKGAVTLPTSQGRCATCQSFSCVADVEGAWFTSGHGLVKLSEQEMIDCGSGNAYGMNWILSNGGIASNADVPLANHSDHTLKGCRGITNCTIAERKSTAYINGSTCLTTHNESNILALLQHGPMSVSINAGPLGGYRGGIINCSGTGIDHAVTLVAYGSDAATGERYWTIKNSWGPDFGESSPPGRTGKGEQGYARLKFGNTCLRGPCQGYVGTKPLWEKEERKEAGDKAIA